MPDRTSQPKNLWAGLSSVWYPGYLIPAYTPLRRKTKPYIKNIKIWPEGALSQLQDLEEYTGTVLSYINHCTDTVTAAKRIRVYPNQKPWMTSKVKTLLQERNSAFRSGDKALYSTARANLKRGIKDAKKAYKEKNRRPSH